MLVPTWVEKHETARRVRQRISAVMQWAVAEGFRSDNPAGDAISAAMPKRTKPRVHHRALPFREVAAAVELLVLTAARSGEVREADRAEVDLGTDTWTIPRERMKGAREILQEARGRVRADLSVRSGPAGERFDPLQAAPGAGDRCRAARVPQFVPRLDT